MTGIGIFVVFVLVTIINGAVFLWCIHAAFGENKAMRIIGITVLLLTLFGCTSDLSRLQSFTVKDIDHAYEWAVWNDDRPAMLCLPTVRYAVVKIAADNPATYGVVTWGQMAGDLANPNGRIRVDCAALAAERKAQVQQAIGQIMSFAASPGLAL